MLRLQLSQRLLGASGGLGESAVTLGPQGLRLRGPSHIAPSGRILYSCRISCTSFSEHWVSVTVELKEMPPPFLGWRRGELLIKGRLQLPTRSDPA